MDRKSFGKRGRDADPAATSGGRFRHDRFRLSVCLGSAVARFGMAVAMSIHDLANDCPARRLKPK
jgi:hypothetical protein